MTAKDIVTQLGGYRNLAAAIGCNPSRAHRWMSQGIPAHRWPALLRIARDRGVSLTLGDLEAAAPEGAA